MGEAGEKCFQQTKGRHEMIISLAGVVDFVLIQNKPLEKSLITLSHIESNKTKS